MNWIGSAEFVGGAIAIAIGVLMVWVLRKPKAEGAIPVMHVTVIPAFILFLLVFGAATILHVMNVL
jgi:hypothetical protein